MGDRVTGMEVALLEQLSIGRSRRPRVARDYSAGTRRLLRRARVFWSGARPAAESSPVNRSRLFLLAIAAALFASACARKDPVKFVPYDEAAIASAQLVAKPVLIYATADW
jgi:hypothetical protein